MNNFKFEEPLLIRIARLYYDERLSAKQVAYNLGISTTHVQRLLRQAGYTLRSPSEAMRLAYKERRATPPNYPKSDSHKEKLSIAQTRYLSTHPHQFSGKHHTEESKVKMSLVHLGVYPSSETRKKMSQVQKTRFSSSHGTMYGKSPSEETRKKIGLANKGKIVTSQTRERMGKARKSRWQDPEYRARWDDPEFLARISIIIKTYWEDSEYRAKMSILRKAQWQNPEYVMKIRRARQLKPNKAELKLQDILDRHYPNTWKYVGDLQVNLGGRFPDYINKNGKKEVIELFGDYWHPVFDIAQRKEEYRQYGFRVAVIWEDELEDEETLIKALPKRFKE